jgi:hypothetical protein
MQRRLFQIELPLHPGWDAIVPLRDSVLACLATVFPDPTTTASLALVTAELLENAVKFGCYDDATESQGPFSLRVDGSGERVEIEVSNPVARDGNLERLQAELDRIAQAPSPEEAYSKAVRALALGRGTSLGLARAAHEGGCDLSATFDGGVVTVRAVTRQIAPPAPTPAAPALPRRPV